MSSPRNEKYASDEEVSDPSQQQQQQQQQEQPTQRRRRQRPRGDRQMQKRQRGGPLGGVDDLGGVGDVTDTAQNVAGGVQNTLGSVAGNTLSSEGGKSDTLRLRLDLNLDIEITLKARIHGDLELALLE